VHLRSAFFWDVTTRHSGCLVSAFRDNVVVSTERVEMSNLPLKMKLCCVETSGTSDPVTWRHIHGNGYLKRYMLLCVLERPVKWLSAVKRTLNEHCNSFSCHYRNWLAECAVLRSQPAETLVSLGSILRGSFISFVSSLSSHEDEGPYCDGLPRKVKKLTLCVGHLFGRRIKLVSKKRKNNFFFLDGTPPNSYSVQKFMAVLCVLGTVSCSCYCRSYVEGKLDRYPPVVSVQLFSLKLPLMLLYVIGAFVGLLEWIKLIDSESLLFSTSLFCCLRTTNSWHWNIFRGGM
jgi:hypothetical protein